MTLITGFTGAAIGNIFNASQGQVSFYLQSRYSFAQRVASAGSQRYAFDVRDGNGSHLFYFLTQIASGESGDTEYLAAGSGSPLLRTVRGRRTRCSAPGVVMQVTIGWSSTGASLYLNNTLVKSVRYTAPTPNWSAALSNFTRSIGAYEYLELRRLQRPRRRRHRRVHGVRARISEALALPR